MMPDLTMREMLQAMTNAHELQGGLGAHRAITPFGIDMSVLTTTSMSQLIYKVLRTNEWAQMQADGVFAGSPDDARDGFIHMSTREQLQATIERHFAEARDIVVLEIDADLLKSDLKWEPSRGGALFPHLYSSLPMRAVLRVLPGRS